MTLIEVLIALSLMLVGIWTLAVGFPKLLGVVTTEERRTEMARQAERTIEQLRRRADNLPLAICGIVPAPYDPQDIDANSRPDDPDIADFGITPPNSRDDMIRIIGERFTIPAPTPPAGYPVNIFTQGLADPPFDVHGNQITYVYEIVNYLPKGFNVEETGINKGQVTWDIPTDVAAVEISYEWWDDDDNVHYVDGEVRENEDKVNAESVSNFDRIVTNSVHGVGRRYFTVVYNPPPGYTLASGEVIQHSSGALLQFNAEDVGRQMRVDYTLRRELLRNNRRALLMSEEHRIISRPQTISLIGAHIRESWEDGTPAYLPVDLDANGDYDDTSIMAVDLSTGEIYAQCFNTLHFSATADPDGASAGQVELLPEIGQHPVGHDLRFYYATLDQDLITIQKAPAVFVEADIAAVANQLLYRSYLPDYVNQAPYTSLWFAPCNAGHTVAVDYKYLVDPGHPLTSPKETVRNEVHTINAEPTTVTVGGTTYNEMHGITLSNPDVQEIIAVRGMSLNARAWWRTPNGRLDSLDVGTVLALTPIE